MQKIDEIGSVYKIFIDPILNSLRKKAVRLVDKDSKVIDIACGTGAFALEMSTKAQHILGIDLSESQIRTAVKSQNKLKIDNVNFELRDATDLSMYKDEEFDLATISLALHQFPMSIAKSVFSEMIRISKELIIVDYAFPMPSRFLKTGIYLIERMAGKDHFNGFRSYMEKGGTKAFIEDEKLEITDEISGGKDIFTIIKCRKNGKVPGK